MTRIFGALKWSLASKIVSTLVQPLTYIIIAKMLGPLEMGKYSVLLMIVSFTQIFWEGGLSKSIIQLEKIGHHEEKTYRTTNLLLGVIVSLVIFIFSRRIAVYFDFSEVLFIRFISLIIFLNSLSVYDIAYLHKKLNYRKLFKLDIYAVLFPSLLALISVFYLNSILPLILILVATPLIRFIYLKSYLKFSYYFVIQKSSLKQIFSFSLYVQMTLLCSWAYRWLDIFILKKHFNLETIGLFRTGMSITNSLSALTFAFIVPVAYSYFSNDLKKNRKEISRFAFKYMESIEVIAFILLWLFCVIVYTLDLYFSDEWSGLAKIALLLFFRELHFRYYGLNVEAIRSLGLVRIELAASITQVILIISGMLIIPKESIEQFVLGYTLVTIISSMLIENYFGIFHLKFSVKMVLRNVAFSVVLACAVVLLSWNLTLFYILLCLWSLMTLPKTVKYIKNIERLTLHRYEG